MPISDFNPTTVTASLLSFAAYSGESTSVSYSLATQTTMCPTNVYQEDERVLHADLQVFR